MFRFLEKKEGASFGPVFQPLLGPLDEAATAIIIESISPYVPGDAQGQKVFFDPYYGDIKRGDVDYHARSANNLRRTVIDKNGLMPLGLLEFCLKYADQSHQVGGVFEAVRKEFAPLSAMLLEVETVYKFRNNHVAHVNVELTDRQLAESGLKEWIALLSSITVAMSRPKQNRLVLKYEPQPIPLPRAADST